MKSPMPDPSRFQITRLALFGDRENGRASESGAFTFAGCEFVSSLPRSRAAAVEINHAMTELRKRSGA
jgi:hypothetical protein